MSFNKLSKHYQDSHVYEMLPVDASPIFLHEICIILIFINILCITYLWMYPLQMSGGGF